MSALGPTIRDLRLAGRVPSSPQGIALLVSGFVLLTVCAGAEGAFHDLVTQWKKVIEQAPVPGTSAEVLEMIRNGLRSMLILSVVYTVAALGFSYLHNGAACSFRIARKKPVPIGMGARIIGSAAVTIFGLCCSLMLAGRLVSQGARLYSASPESWPPAANGLVIRHLSLLGFSAVCIGGGCITAAWILFIRNAYRHQLGGGEG
jgi:hypothetical protein